MVVRRPCGGMKIARDSGEIHHITPPRRRQHRRAPAAGIADERHMRRLDLFFGLLHGIVNAFNNFPRQTGIRPPAAFAAAAVAPFHKLTGAGKVEDGIFRRIRRRQPQGDGNFRGGVSGRAGARQPCASVTFNVHAQRVPLARAQQAVKRELFRGEKDAAEAVGGGHGGGFLPAARVRRRGPQQRGAAQHGAAQGRQQAAPARRGAEKTGGTGAYAALHRRQGLRPARRECVRQRRVHLPCCRFRHAAHGECSLSGPEAGRRSRTARCRRRRRAVDALHRKDRGRRGKAAAWGPCRGPVHC